jgi:DNA-binding response OmpR family regulator
VISVVSAKGPELRSSPPRRGLAIDRATRDIRLDGRRIRLTYREFELLIYLASRPGRAVSRAELMREVWRIPASSSADISDRTVDTHIRRLRVKLGDYRRTLPTVRGHGYRFDAGPDVHVATSLARRYSDAV